MTDRWRFCNAGEILFATVNETYPDRPIGQDGVIGDSAHSARASDHNPNKRGVVTAWDLTADTWVKDFVEWLADSRDKRLKYVIYKRRIWSLERANEGWRLYDGDDAHIGHAHISFSADPKYYDSTLPWHIFDNELDTEDMTPAEKALLTRIDKNLSALVAPRRPDHADRDKSVIDLGDILNRIDKLEEQFTKVITGTE